MIIWFSIRAFLQEFRRDLDRKREEAYANMTVEEIAKMREDMKLLRKPGKINSARAKAAGLKNKEQENVGPPEPTAKNMKEYFAYHGYDIEDHSVREELGYLDVFQLSRQIKERKDAEYGTARDEDVGRVNAPAEYSGELNTTAKMKERKRLQKEFRERQRRILEKERRAEDELFAEAADRKNNSSGSDAQYAKDFFAEGAKRSRQQFENAKEQWNEAQFFSDPGGSSHATGAFIPRGIAMPLSLVRFVVFSLVVCIGTETYLRMNESVDNLAEKRRAYELELNGKKE